MELDTLQNPWVNHSLSWILDFFFFPFICLVAVKLLLDNNISDWVFIVIVCNVAVPAGHSQDCGSVVIDAHKLLVRDSPCLDGVKM